MPMPRLRSDVANAIWVCRTQAGLWLAGRVFGSVVAMTVLPWSGRLWTVPASAHAPAAPMGNPSQNALGNPPEAPMSPRRSSLPGVVTDDCVRTGAASWLTEPGRDEEGASLPPPRVVSDRRRLVSAQAELSGAGRPGAPPLRRLQVLGDPDLLLAGRVGRAARATGGLPAALRELQAAVIAVAGVDGPVAARLALRELVPDTGAGAGGGGGGLRGGSRRRGGGLVLGGLGLVVVRRGRGGRARGGRARRGAGQVEVDDLADEDQVGVLDASACGHRSPVVRGELRERVPGLDHVRSVRGGSPADVGEADDADGGNRRGNGRTLHGSLEQFVSFCRGQGGPLDRPWAGLTRLAAPLRRPLPPASASPEHRYCRRLGPLGRGERWDDPAAWP